MSYFNRGLYGGWAPTYRPGATLGLDPREIADARFYARFNPDAQRRAAARASLKALKARDARAYSKASAGVGKFMRDTYNYHKPRVTTAGKDWIWRQWQAADPSNPINAHLYFGDYLAIPGASEQVYRSAGRASGGISKYMQYSSAMMRADNVRAAAKTNNISLAKVVGTYWNLIPPVNRRTVDIPTLLAGTNIELIDMMGPIYTRNPQFNSKEGATRLASIEAAQPHISKLISASAVGLPIVAAAPAAPAVRAPHVAAEAGVREEGMDDVPGQGWY